MVTYSDALLSQQQKVQEARAKIEEQKRITQEAQDKAKKAREILLSQRNLRNGGIGGLNRRQQGIAQVGQVEAQVEERNKIIETYDTEIGKAESQIADAKEREEGYYIAQKAMSRDNPFIVHFSDNRYAKDYYEDMLNAKNSQEELNESLSKGVIPDNVQTAIDKISKNVGEEKAYKIVLGWDKDETRNFRDFQTSKISMSDLPAVEVEGVVAQSQVRLPKDLNVSNASLGNVTIRDVGLSDRTDSKVQSGNRISRWFSNLIGSRKEFEENFEKAQGFPSKELGGFVSAAPGTLQGGTLVLNRPFTAEESAKIESADYRGNLFASGGKAISVREIVDTSNRFNELTKDFDKLSYDEQQSRIGQLKQIGATINDKNEIVRPTIEFGFGAKKRQFGMEEIDTRSSFDVVKSSLFGSAERIATKTAGYVLPQKGVATIDAYNITIPVSTRSTIQTDAFGNPIETKQIEVPSYNILTPAQVGRVTRIAGEAGFYAVPYAFATEQVARLGEKGFKGYIKTYPVETAIVGTIGALKAGQFLFKASPSTIIKPGQPVRETVVADNGMAFIIERPQGTAKFNYVDVSKPIVKGDKQVTATMFKVTREVPTQYAQEGQSRLGRLFFSGKQIEVAPKRLDVGVSDTILIGESGDIINKPKVYTKREGGNLISVSQLKAKQFEVTPEDFFKLPKEQQLRFQALAEQRTGGIPVSLSNVPGMLKKSDLLSVGEVNVERFLRVSPKQNTINYYTYGKRTTRSSLASQSRPVFANEEFTIFKGEISAKDITLPKIRTQRGNEIVMTGVSKVYKPQIIDDVADYSLPTQIRQVPKVKVKPVLDTLQKAQEATAKQFPTPKVNLPKPTTDLAKSAKEIEEGLSLKAVKVSTAEEKLLERTQNAQIVSPVTSNVLIDKQGESLDTGLDTSQKTSERTAQIFKQTPAQVDIIKTSPKESQVPAISFGQLQETQVKSITLKTPTRTNRPYQPKPKIPKKIINPEFPSTNKGLSIDKIKGLFEIIKKKRGKEIKVGEETSLTGAGTRLKKELLSGLEASGFIREKSSGRKISFGEIANIVGGEFRAGKRDPFKIVQRKGGREGGLGRLTTRSERLEIKQARRSKSKKLKWF